MAVHRNKNTDSMIHALAEPAILADSRGADTWSVLSMIEIQGNQDSEGLLLGDGAMVVLSACNTGRGEIKAEGIVGLTRGFLLAIPPLPPSLFGAWMMEAPPR